MKPTEVRSLLKAWMKEHGKNATDVASLTGVSPKTVERFVEGETVPRPLQLEAFTKLVQPAPAGA